MTRALSNSEIGITFNAGFTGALAGLAYLPRAFWTQKMCEAPTGNAASAQAAAAGTRFICFPFLLLHHQIVLFQHRAPNPFCAPAIFNATLHACAYMRAFIPLTCFHNDLCDNLCGYAGRPCRRAYWRIIAIKSP